MPEAARTATGGVHVAGPCLAELHDVALLDLDGVVYVGRDAVPHAASSLEAARARFGMRSVFVTNNASRPPRAVAEHLIELGVRAEPGDVVTSAQAGAGMLAGLIEPGSAVLAIGGPGVAEALSERGFKPVRNVDDGAVAVMQGYGPDVGWAQLAEASLAIGRGLPWVATNLDATIPTPRGRVLGNGSLVAALQHSSGIVPLVAGKPETPLMRESIERAGALRPIVVGDRLDTDIEGAARAGIPSLLVLTGVTDWQDLVGVRPEHRPTHLGRDLRDLLEPMPEIDVVLTADFAEGRCRAATVRVPRGPGRAERVQSAPAGQAADGRTGDPLWWVPQPYRNTGQGRGADIDPADLDVVRALVWISWAMDDAGSRIVDEAQVHVDR